MITHSRRSTVSRQRNVGPTKYTFRNVGRRIKTMRTDAHITQVELARRLRVSQPLISLAETGKVKIDPTYLPKIMKACKSPRLAKA